MTQRRRYKNLLRQPHRQISHLHLENNPCPEGPPRSCGGNRGGVRIVPLKNMGKSVLVYQKRRGGGKLLRSRFYEGSNGRNRLTSKNNTQNHHKVSQNI